MAKKPIAAILPHEGHEKHLCYLVNLKVKTSELKKFVKDAQFICKNCGRAAKSDGNLCNPVKL